MASPLPPTLDVPLFPLPGVVLFPGALLPLRVFEPRYVQLLTDVLATDKLIGMPQIKPGGSFSSDSPEAPAPALYPVFGVGSIVAHQPMDDGTHHIALLGQARCKLKGEVPHQPYRIGSAVTLVDRIPENSEQKSRLKSTHKHMMAQAGAVIGKTMEGDASSQLKKALDDRKDPGPAADLLASVYVQDAHLKQLLLETMDVNARVGLVAAVLEKLMCRLEPREPIYEYKLDDVNLN
jgi:Lon protease-like protein